MLTIISLPGTAVADITGHTSDLFTDLSDIIFLVLGVLLGVAIIVQIIHAIRSR